MAVDGRTEPTPPGEQILADIWHAGLLASEMRLVDSRRLRVIYRGTWTFSDGPDFHGAMLDIGGRLVRGDIELHVRASDWVRHGHHQDPRYDGVVLHVVHIDDLDQPVLTSADESVPTLLMSRFYQAPLETLESSNIPAVAGAGHGPCLPTLPGERPELVRQVLEQEGWRRLTEKQLAFSQALTVLPAGEILYRGIAEALGYSRNREPMLQVASDLPLVTLERLASEAGSAATCAGLLAVAGFLPLDATMAQSMDIDPAWAAILSKSGWDLLERLGLDSQPSSSWTLNRVRPANHPTRRLASLADLVVRTAHDGLVGSVLSAALAGGDHLDRLFAGVTPTIGAQRRRQIITNIVAPFLAAYADALQDDLLGEQVSDWWQRLPGSADDQISRLARRQIVGRRRFPIRSALAEQGLHRIAREGCRQLRCFECPIAQLAAIHEGPLSRAVMQAESSSVREGDR